MDALPDMTDFSREKCVAPDTESGFARPVAEHVVLADDLSLIVGVEAKIRLCEFVEDLHIDQQASGWNAMHFKQIARKDGGLLG